MDNYLGRDDAPFGDEVWTLLDDTVIQAAKSILSGRRILEIEGPYGFGLKQIPSEDKMISEGAVTVFASKSVPVPLFETGFTLSSRDIVSYLGSGYKMNLSPVAGAALAVAAMEDTTIFQGNRALGIDGLLTVQGTQSHKLSNWESVGAAAADIIAAVTKLDEQGFHEPYTLALSPALYNMLYRLYPQAGRSELEHIKSVTGSEVVKAPSLKNGGVLLASRKQYASIVIGQDMMTGYVGPNGAGYEFTITESLVPIIRVPASICILKP